MPKFSLFTSFPIFQGQAAAIGFLLSVMGFKDYMDSNGRFISQEQADGRVREMELVRNELLQRLEEEQQRKADARRLLMEAQEKDLRKKQQNSKSAEQVAEDLTTDASPPRHVEAMATMTKE